MAWIWLLWTTFRYETVLSYNTFNNKQDLITQGTTLNGFNIAGSSNINFFNPANQLDVQQLNYGVIAGIGTTLSTLSTSIGNLATGKQDLLVAGAGIDITNNIISSRGGNTFVGFRVFTTTGTHTQFLLNQTLTIDFDEGINYNNVGTNRGYFIAPTNGYYSFKGKIRLPSGSNARSFVAFYIDRGSGRVEYESFYADLSVSDYSTIARGQTSSCIAKLNAGDKMTLGLDATASTIGSAVVDIIFSGYKINDF